ncbi:hypothetical protein LT493_42795 [Streptomyces tricolor]|nr:hypothetical protein [Streptomyces tricolor]
MLRYLTERLPVMVTPSWCAPGSTHRRRDVLRAARRRRGPAGRGEPDLRHRRSGRPDVPGHDGPLRAGRGAPPGGSSCPSPSSPPACPAIGWGSSRPSRRPWRGP